MGSKPSANWSAGNGMVLKSVAAEGIITHRKEWPNDLLAAIDVLLHDGDIPGFCAIGPETEGR
jgi:hypothetical protein